MIVTLEVLSPKAPLPKPVWDGVIDCVGSNQHFGAFIKGLSRATAIPVARIAKAPRTAEIGGKPNIGDEWTRDRFGRPKDTPLKVRLVIAPNDHLEALPGIHEDVQTFLQTTEARRALAGLAKRFRVHEKDVKVLTVPKQKQKEATA